jgi:hypothetical protein
VRTISELFLLPVSRGFLGLLFNTENRGKTFLRNTYRPLSDYTTLCLQLFIKMTVSWYILSEEGWLLQDIFIMELTNYCGYSFLTSLISLLKSFWSLAQLIKHWMTSHLTLMWVAGLAVTCMSINIPFSQTFRSIFVTEMQWNQVTTMTPHIQSPTLHSRCGINKGLIKRGSTIDHWRSRCKG